MLRQFDSYPEAMCPKLVMCVFVYLCVCTSICHKFINISWSWLFGG